MDPANSGDLGMAEALVSLGADLEWAGGWIGETPLIIAIESGLSLIAYRLSLIAWVKTKASSVKRNRKISGYETTTLMRAHLDRYVHPK